MKRKILICFFLFITTFAHAQKRFYQVSGKVVDPKTGKGISGVYVAFQGQYFELFFGGPEYFDDLVFDSTNHDGRFSLHIPFKIIDSFLHEHGEFFPNFRFALSIRTERDLNAAEMYFGNHILVKMLPIGNETSFRDRNYINHRTLILTEKNKRIRGDTTGMVIPLHKGGVVHFIMPVQDTAFMNNNFLHVVVQELNKENGEVIVEDQTNFDLTERVPRDNMLVKPYTIMNMILCKWPRHENTMDTLTIIKNVELKPGEIRNIAVPPSAKKKN